MLRRGHVGCFALAGAFVVATLACAPAQPAPVSAKAQAPEGERLEELSARCRTGNLPACETVCRAGRPQGCFLAGFLHELGEANPVDMASAFVRYHEGCEAGHVLSCSNLGWMYARGRGVARDERRAMAIFLRVYDSYRHACATGDPSACLSAALMLSRGEQVPRDERLAAVLVARACELGDRRGCELSPQPGRAAPPSR
jgi:TPR repeat protein